MVTLKGKEIELRRLNVRDMMRLTKVMQQVVTALNVDPEEVKKTSENVSLAELFKLSARILEGALGDFDLETNRPGTAAQMVFTEIHRLTDIPLEDLYDATQEEFMAIFAELWRLEGDGPFVRSALNTIQPFIIPLLLTFEHLKRALMGMAVGLIGGVPSGGEPLSSYQLLNPPTDGESPTSSIFPSETPSPINEPQPSGVS